VTRYRTLFRRIAALFSRRYGVRCRLGGQHNPFRVPMGLRCYDCKSALEDLDEAGILDGAYVSPVRRLYSREHGGSITKTEAWEPTRRGF
jgi:hypothetical protein